MHGFFFGRMTSNFFWCASGICRVGSNKRMVCTRLLYRYVHGSVFFAYITHMCLSIAVLIDTLIDESLSRLCSCTCRHSQSHVSTRVKESMSVCFKHKTIEIIIFDVDMVILCRQDIILLISFRTMCHLMTWYVYAYSSIIIPVISDDLGVAYPSKETAAVRVDSEH